VSQGSSKICGWVANYVDYAYVSLTTPLRSRRPTPCLCQLGQNS